jgi:hypothetical protein
MVFNPTIGKSLNFLTSYCVSTAMQCNENHDLAKDHGETEPYDTKGYKVYIG